MGLGSLLMADRVVFDVVPHRELEERVERDLRLPGEEHSTTFELEAILGHPLDPLEGQRHIILGVDPDLKGARGTHRKS